MDDKRRLRMLRRAIKQRCYDKNSADYRWYGARSIKLCDAWLQSPAAFVHWALDNGYAQGLTLDRIDPDGDYSPENCRWVDRKAQSNNRRNSKRFVVGAKEYSQAELCRRYNIHPRTFRDRLKRGWSLERAIGRE